MTQKPQNNNLILIIISIVGVVGTICAALITVIGNAVSDKSTQRAALTQNAVDATARATPKTITITLTNNFCTVQDFYVDGNLMVPGIVPNAKVPFVVFSGEHEIHSCNRNPVNCGDPVHVNWTTSRDVNITPSTTHACLITITLTNNHCTTQDYYVDDQVVVPSLAANVTTTFQVEPGQHSVYVCTAGTSSCGEKVQLNWTTSTSASINGNASACLQIALTNNHCLAEDYFVDGHLAVASLAAGATTTFLVAPGQHSVYVCTAGTSSCGEIVQLDWTASTTASIARGLSCP